MGLTVCNLDTLVLSYIMDFGAFAYFIPSFPSHVTDALHIPHAASTVSALFDCV